jgi:hypothetical protein
VGLNEITRISNTGPPESIADAPIFFGGKNMFADRQIIGVAVNELEWEHSKIGS